MMSLSATLIHGRERDGHEVLVLVLLSLSVLVHGPQTICVIKSLGASCLASSQKWDEL